MENKTVVNCDLKAFLKRSVDYITECEINSRGFLVSF